MSTFTFKSPRGHDLSSRYEGPAGVTKATAVFAHCFTCSKDLRVERQIVSALVAQGIGVLTFDFTGLGRSEGEFGSTTFTADVADVVAAAEELGRRVAAPALLIGHSLGGAAVLHAAHRIDSCRAVVTVGAPADPAHVKHLLSDGIDAITEHGSAEVTIAGRSFTISKQFIDDLDDRDPTAAVRNLGRALLIFHAPTDETVGIENARMIYEAARHPKSFVSLDGADHLLTDPADALYVASVTAAWAARYVGRHGRPNETGESKAAEASAYDDNAVVAVTGDGLVTDVMTRGFVLTADEPAAIGGTQTGPTPYDFLGAALATCTSMTLRLYADRKGIALATVSTTVTHESVHADDCKDCEHTEGQIAVLHRSIALEGDLSEDDRERLLKIANKCPVHRTLEGPIEVHTAVVAV